MKNLHHTSFVWAFVILHGPVPLVVWAGMSRNWKVWVQNVNVYADIPWRLGFVREVCANTWPIQSEVQMLPQAGNKKTQCDLRSQTPSISHNSVFELNVEKFSSQSSNQIQISSTQARLNYSENIQKCTCMSKSNLCFRPSQTLWWHMFCISFLRRLFYF